MVIMSTQSFDEFSDKIVLQKLQPYVDNTDNITKRTCKRHLESVLNLEPRSLNDQPHKSRFKKILATALENMKAKSEEKDEESAADTYAPEIEEEPKKRSSGKKRKRNNSRNSFEQPQKKAKFGQKLTKLRKLAKTCNLAGPALYKKLKGLPEKAQCSVLIELFEEKQIDVSDIRQEALDQAAAEYNLRMEVEGLKQAEGEILSTRRARKNVKYTYSSDEDSEDEYGEKENDENFDVEDEDDGDSDDFNPDDEDYNIDDEGY